MESVQRTKTVITDAKNDRSWHFISMSVDAESHMMGRKICGKTWGNPQTDFCPRSDDKIHHCKHDAENKRPHVCECGNYTW
jgi:hypothetical protein